MPILVKDYTWEETDKTLDITVPLKGVAANKADILATDDYLKVSYPPYLFEIWLSGSVDEEQSRASKGNGIVLFQLQKQKLGIWNSLKHPDSEDKEKMKVKRQEIIEHVQKKAEEEQKRITKEKSEKEKYALRELMKLEQEERESIAKRKEEEKRKALEEVDVWKNEKVDEVKEILVSAVENKDKIVEANKEITLSLSDKPKTQPSKKPSGASVKSNVSKAIKTVPAPRPGGKIEVSFTPRAFRTAARESKAPEEEEWLKKVAEAGRMKKTDNTDAVDMEEMNPLWLKDKGINFYKQGNYVAAINAFTAALLLDDSVPALYSNRAACHLHLKQYKECIQDCTSSLDALTPPVSDNANSRCKAYVRRGTAHFNLENYIEALQDYEAGLQLDPNNEQLQADAQKIRNIIEGDKPPPLCQEGSQSSS